MGLSNNIFELRTSKGVSQEELAEKVGVHQTFISHIEKGIKTPTVSMLVAIADELDCSTDYLLDRERFINRKEN
ncbi:MAG: helix-turn-helix transcriptional regulator [Lachnospiraceae bacterium]|nr:helix-turn-helix transcriptional regulator [Lachnospiraceae bacterium]MCM1237270.1 helix-turn-helix transcriptional regulator [Ruminococcus flavefaciens]